MNWYYASIIVFLILGILGLIKEIQREKGEKVHSLIFLIFIFIILLAIIQGIIKYQEDEKAKYSANSGLILEGISNSNVQNITYLVGPTKVVGFQNRTIFGKNGVVSISFCEDDILSTRIEYGKLKISSVLRDKDGHIVARILSNEWTVNPKFMWDKNFDNEAFEVIDDKNNIILQVLLYGDTVRIRGDFYCSGNRIFIDDNGWHFNPSKKLSIEPIFKYPSIDHPGERISTMNDSVLKNTASFS